MNEDAMVSATISRSVAVLAASMLMDIRHLQRE